MKYFILLLLLFSNFSFSQVFKVLNKYKKQPIPLASIVFFDGSGTFTNDKGEFIIPLKNQVDSIKISSIGFSTKNISIKDLKNNPIVLLEEEVSVLEEVLIQSKNSEILKHKKGINAINVEVRDFTYEELVVTFIPFPEGFANKDIAISIKSIVVNTTGLRSKKRRYYPFKVNLYSVNKKNRPPLLKDSLLTGIIASRKRGESHIVKVNIKDSKVNLDKNGIFVSFETLGKKDYPQDTLYKSIKLLHSVKFDEYNDYAAAVKTIRVNPKITESHSFSLNKNRELYFKDDNIEDYWKFERGFIYDLTIEIEY